MTLKIISLLALTSLIASIMLPGNVSQPPNPLHATGKGYICNTFTDCPSCVPNGCHAVGSVWKDTTCNQHYICGPGGVGGSSCSNNGTDYCYTTFTYNAAGCGLNSIVSYFEGGTFNYCGS